MLFTLDPGAATISRMQAIGLLRAPLYFTGGAVTSAAMLVALFGACGDDSGASESATASASAGATEGGTTASSGDTEGTSDATASTTEGTTENTTEGTTETTTENTTGPTSGATESTHGDHGDPAEPPEVDLVTYAGARIFHRVHRLSDGSLLISGQAADLTWIPAEVPRIELDAGAIVSASAGNLGFLLHVAADLQELLHVAHFPPGTVRDIVRIRSTEVPGQPTGDLYISGRRDPSDVQEDGYYLAKLDNNFVAGPPTGVLWTYDVRARPRQAGGFSGESHYKSVQPWDLTAEGAVIFGLGSEYDFSWAAIERLSPAGIPEKVAGWPGQEWADHSAIVMKAGRRGSLRSTTQAEYEALQSDGNGRDDRQGTWPDDYFFSGPCVSDDDCPGGPGYTGYRTSDKPTQRVGDIVVDRRSGWMYFGYSTQSVLPSNHPDFEPAVVAMDGDGYLQWWSRLYHERVEKEGGGYHQNSSPDQYVDDLEIDYASDRLVVFARAHGNNVINLWSGDQIAAEPEAQGFQNRFTGTNGNIHISWLGKLALTDGTLHGSTYVAEYVDGDTNFGAPFADGPLAGWPNPNAGWPDVNTTRCPDAEIAVGAAGEVLVVCQGRRTFTTAGAYQEMLLPGAGSSTWNAFARIYSPDLRELRYSTVLVGTWDPADGAGGGNTRLSGIIPAPGAGFYAVGSHLEDDDGEAQGNPIPTTAIPDWGSETPTGESAIVAYFTAE